MTEVEQTLDTHKEIAVSQEEIKQQLTEQKVLHISGLSMDDLLVRGQYGEFRVRCQFGL